MARHPNGTLATCIMTAKLKKLKSANSENAEKCLI